jgi:ParB-like chromosome segregation protein Spo0J
MVDVDVDELKILSPDDRIKRLKEIEEERKQEIERAQELIKECEEELEREEDVKRIMETVEIPQQQKINVEQLIINHQSKSLEQSIEEAKPEQSIEEFNMAQFYEQNVNLKDLAGSIYSKLSDLKDKSFSDTYWTSEEQNQFNTIKNKISGFYINQGYDNAKQVTDILDASKKILKDLGYNTGVGE